MAKKLFLIALALSTLVSCSVFQKGNKNLSKVTRVKIETDSGVIVARLYNETPLHTNNFIQLVKEHFYDGILFHRVINDFMIQGGDPTSRNAKPGELLGDGGVKKLIAAEISPDLFHQFGAIAAARESDDKNPSRASSYSQFYIVEGRTFTDDELDQVEKRFDITIPEAHREVYRTVGGTPFLDGKYTVFGQVESGLDVIRKIASAKTDENNRPVTDIKMKIRILK